MTLQRTTLRFCAAEIYKCRPDQLRRVAGILIVGVTLGMWIAAGVAATRTQVADWPVEPMPQPLPSRQVRFPHYEMRTLPNGMQVVAVLHHGQPAVSIRMIVRAGSVENPGGKPGLAALAASLLDQGTTTKSAARIASAIDDIGGALGTGAGSDLTFVNAIVMKDSFGTAMDLIADIVRNPAFAPDEIERQKQQALSTMQVNRTDPEYVATAVFDRLVYGVHPYGSPGSGTPESLAAITRGDLQEFHRKYYVPNNMILGIVGDVTSQEAFAAAERVFGSWPRATLSALKLADPPSPRRRVVIVDMPDAVQTELRVGHLGIPRKHRDYMPIDLAFRILGGEGANRLQRVLRSERGLTYSASADIETMKHAGDFVASTDTRTPTTGEALRLMVQEFMRLQRERVDERELADAQAYLAGNFPLTIETPDEIATQVLNDVFYDLPVAEIGTFPQRVQSVTAEDIQRVARSYVFPDRLTVVLVGNASGFVSQLKAIGFSEFDVIPIEQLDLASISLKRDSRRAALLPHPSDRDPRLVLRGGGAVRGLVPILWRDQATSAPAGPPGETSTSARELVAKAIDAKGGLARLKAVRTVVAEANTTFRIQPAPLPSSTTTYVMYPDRFRVDAMVGGANVIQVYDRGNAWLKDPHGVTDAPIPMRAEFAASVERDIIPLLVGAADGTRTVRLLPEEGKDGRVYRVIEIIGALRNPVRLYIDAKGMVSREAYTEPGPLGRPTQVEEVFSDYRSVDGIQVPFHAELRQNGQTVLDRTLTTVKINSDVDRTLFEKPTR
jgi:zinc protease